jgi:AhpD family alkylhydroperoxidase
MSKFFLRKILIKVNYWTVVGMGETKERLEELDVYLKDLLSRAPELQIFGEYSEKARESRVLNKKFKELIALGISIAIRCEPCILRHLNEVVKSGANIDEIVEVIKIAVVMGGGPSLAYGVKAYKAAKELIRV